MSAVAWGLIGYVAGALTMLLMVALGRVARDPEVIVMVVERDPVDIVDNWSVN